MAPREKPELNSDVEPWERWTIAVCGRDEPPKLFRIFQEYARTSPRSLRVALVRACGLKGKAARNARASGALYRASQFWSWRRRADEWDLHVARIEKAAFNAHRAAARRRRIKQLDSLNVALGLRLAALARKATLESLLRLHEAEREELRDRPEDDAAHLGEHEPPLPRIEDVIRPPEPVEHKPPEPE